MKLSAICAFVWLGYTKAAKAFAPPAPLSTRATFGRVATIHEPYLSELKHATCLFDTSGGATGGDDTPLFGELMLINEAEVLDQISENWGKILTVGVLNTIAGSAAMAYPILSTAISEMGLIITLAVAGVTNVVGTFFVEKGYKAHSFALGAAQIGLAYLVNTNPLESIISITSLIAATSVVDGLYRVTLAVQNKDLPGRGLAGLTGLAAVGAGVIIFNQLPESSLFVLGLTVGAQVLSFGLSRINIGLTGRDLAKND